MAALPAENGVPTEVQADRFFTLDIPYDPSNPNATFAQVGANVANFMLLIAGIIVVVMVIVSGVQMIVSGGEEAKAEAAKKRLINALLATAVITLTFGIVAFIKNLIIAS